MCLDLVLAAWIGSTLYQNYRSPHQLHSDDLQALQRELAETRGFLQDLKSRQSSCVWRVWISGLGLCFSLLLHLLCISLLPFWLWTTYQGLDVLADAAVTSDGSASRTKRVEWDQQSAVKCEDGAQRLKLDARQASSCHKPLPASLLTAPGIAALDLLARCFELRALVKPFVVQTSNDVSKRERCQIAFVQSSRTCYC